MAANWYFTSGFLWLLRLVTKISFLTEASLSYFSHTYRKCTCMSGVVVSKNTNTFIKIILSHPSLFHFKHTNGLLHSNTHRKHRGPPDTETPYWIAGSRAWWTDTWRTATETKSITTYSFYTWSTIRNLIDLLNFKRRKGSGYRWIQSRLLTQKDQEEKLHVLSWNVCEITQNIFKINK